MIIRSLELANFRKFREPLCIDGFSDGLNIVVEPNETGKSTLLEALRAAFFIRHSAKTELVRSYVPIGDDGQVTAVARGVFRMGGACLQVHPQVEEVCLAQAAGWHKVSLGPRTLRVETAAIVMTVIAMQQNVER